MRPIGTALLATFLFVLVVSQTAFGVTVAIWHSLTDRLGLDAFEASIDAFEAANPGIEVEVVYAGGYVEAMEKAMTAYVGGAAPNLLHLEQTRSAAFYFANALHPIDGYVEGPDGIDLGDFSPAMLGAVTYDGKLYGLPYNVSTPLLYYNRDLFRRAGLRPEAPKTPQEILDVSLKIARDRNGDGVTDVFGIDFYTWGWLFEAWIGRYGARVHDEEFTEFTFNAPEAVEAMEFVRSLVNEYRVATNRGNYGMFWAGELAMRELSTASLADNIRNARENSMDMGVAPLPCHVECYAPIGGGNLFLMNTGSAEQKEAAWKLLKHLTSTESLANYSASSGYMVARRSSFASPVLQEVFQAQPEFRVTYEQLDFAYPRPKLPFWQSDVAPLLEQFFKAQFAGENSVKALLDEAVRVANGRLEAWRGEVGR